MTRISEWRTHFYRACAAAVLLIPTVCSAQRAGTANKIEFKADPKIVTRYPSMEPVTVIDLELGTATDPAVIDAVRAAIRGGWDCGKTSAYDVSITGGSAAKDDPVILVNVVGQPFGKPCDAGNLNVVQLTLQFPIGDQKKFQVALRTGDKNVVIQSAAAAGPKSGADVNFTATPQSVAGETLTNKKTREVGQLNVSFLDSDFIRNLPVDVYLKSTDLFSTDEKDAKSAFLETAGFSRGIFRDWYSPGHLEAGMQGNQNASNLSLVADAGLTTLVPWKAFMSGIIQLPLAPDITLNGQYTNRLRQMLAAGQTRLAENDFAVNPSLAWTSVSFPWTCSLFGWLNGDKGNAGMKASDQYKYCVGAEVDFGMWYLPFDLTSRGSQRVEGYGDFSLLIPLASLNFARGIAPQLTSGDYTKSRIRIKYSDSVNAASNYIRSKSWTYGIELVK